MTIPTSAALNAYAKVADMGLDAAQSPAAGKSTQEAAFGEVLQGVVDELTASGRAGEQQTAAAAAGQADIVDVVTAVAEAETTLQMVVAVRDRVIAAYQDIMRMPI